MRNGARTVRDHLDRFDAWFRVDEPVTYRDAWRYGLLYGVVLGTFAVGYFVVGSPLWPTFLALVVPTMAAFTLGFAVRAGTARQRLRSLAVGLAGAGAALALPGVREDVLAIGAPGILLAWLLILIGLLGYAFPEYGEAA